jgi:DNA polymerase-3 subunit delta'
MDLFGDPEPDDEFEPDEFLELPPLKLPETSAQPAVCIGHEHNQHMLLEAYNHNRMPHGIILSGPKGIGKALLAHRIAAFLLHAGITDPNALSLFGDPPPALEHMNIPADSQAFRLIASGAHPDMLNVGRAYDATKDKFKDGVAVDDIRKVAPFLRKTASLGGWRVVIIDDADTMNRNAQNALLKILEEPPANTVLMLVTHRMGAMIPTIRSRCRVLNFSALSQTDFAKILSSSGHFLEDTKLQTLYEFSKGSIGRALEFIEHGGLETLESILDLLQSYPAWPWPEIHRLGEQLSKSGKDDAYKQFTVLLSWIYAEMAKAKARGTSLTGGYFEGSAALQNLMRQSSLESLLKICENLEGLFDTVQRSNLDKKQAVLSAFSLIAA